MRGQSFDVKVAAFGEQLFAPETEVYDPEGIHHELSQGLHGRKVDCDLISENTPLYQEWIDLKADMVWQSLPKRTLGKVVLIGIANGTNRIARDTADTLGCVEAIETYKDEDGHPALSQEAADRLKSINPSHIRFVEDVFTRGTNVMWAASSVHTNRPSRLEDIEAIALLERGVPERLLSIGLKYRAAIRHHMRDFGPNECLTNPGGYCARQWELIPHKKPQAA